MNISVQIERIRKELPPAVKLVAVSKFKPVECIKEAYEAGQRTFAESRPQEFEQKAKSLEKDIEWHFIGHLQTNKLKMVIPYVSMIQSVDSQHLLTEIDKAAGKEGKIIDCLLEVHVAKEETKQGFSEDELFELEPRLDSFQNVRICGIMGMATFTDDETVIRDEFRRLKMISERLKSKRPQCSELSMGMSGDYRIAIEEGTTIVRIGTAIFGERNYQ